MELVAISPFFWLILFIWILSLFFLVSLARGLQVLFILLKKYFKRRKWQPTPVLLPGNSLEHRNLVGYSPWSCRVRHDWGADTHTHTHSWDTWWCKGILYLLFHLLQEAGWGRKHLEGRMACHTHSSGSLGASVPATAGLGQIKD